MSADEAGGPEEELERLRELSASLGFCEEVIAENLNVDLAPTFDEHRPARTRLGSILRRATRPGR